MCSSLVSIVGYIMIITLNYNCFEEHWQSFGIKTDDILLVVDKENNNDPLKIWGLYLFVLAFLGECVNQLGSEVKSIPERSAGGFKTLDVWHRLMLCDIKIFFIDMKFGINQAISQTITQLSCIQLETPSSRLWNFWWIKTYTTFKVCIGIEQHSNKG